MQDYFAAASKKLGPSPERARIRNREIGFIFQSFNLIGDLTVYENVELPLTYRGMPSSERKAAVTQALESEGIRGEAERIGALRRPRQRLAARPEVKQRRPPFPAAPSPRAGAAYRP